MILKNGSKIGKIRSFFMGIDKKDREYLNWVIQSFGNFFKFKLHIRRSKGVWRCSGKVGAVSVEEKSKELNPLTTKIANILCRYHDAKVSCMYKKAGIENPEEAHS